MTESMHGTHSFPRVTEQDLLEILLEDNDDPEHRVRWGAFALRNPRLAREIMDQIDRQVVPAQIERDRRQAAMNVVTYAVRALEIALNHINDGAGDGAGPQP